MTLTEDFMPAPDPEAVQPEPERAPVIQATPAMLAGLALVAAFFMPLVSAFGGLFTFSPWSYLRLAFDSSSDLSIKDWVIVGLMPTAAILGLAVAITEARGKRIRPLVGAAAVIPIGLLIYIAIDIGSVKDFRYADMAGYLATAAALVLLTTAIGLLDRDQTMRRVVYVVCGLLVIAGVAVPSTGNSLEDSFEEMFEGFNMETGDDGTTPDDTISSFSLSDEVMNQLEEVHDIDAFVDCPDDIAREVGETTTCTYETLDSDDEFNVEVKVTGLDEEDDGYELELVPSTTPN